MKTSLQKKVYEDGIFGRQDILQFFSGEKFPQFPRQITSADLLLNPSINPLKFYCIKQIDYIFRCVCVL